MSDIDSKSSRSEAALSAALRELAHSASQSAPPELGDGLMHAFHRHHARRRIARATALVSAVLVVFGGSLVWIHTRSAGSSAPKQPNSAASSSSELPAQQKQQRSTKTNVDPAAPGRVSAEHASTFAARKSSMSRHTPPQSATARSNPAAEEVFVALPSFAFRSPDEELRVIRVNMPISSLRLLGAPIDDEPMTRRVNTDLLIGSDGTPYAVKLVM